MELNIQEVLEAAHVLEKIAFDVNIKGRYALKLLKNLDKLKEEIERLDKLRLPIINKYCDKDKNGEPIITNNSYSFTNTNNRQKMINEINELFAETIEVPIEKIDMEAIENVNISMAQISQIRFMLKLE